MGGVHKPKIPLSQAEIDVLIALGQVEPADVRLIDFTRGGVTGSSHVLPALVERGLAGRQRAHDQPPLTREEKWARKQLRGGKRPYLYELTGTGKTVAHHLQAIANQLRGAPE